MSFARLMPMSDLFTSNNRCRICIHNATEQECIMVDSIWINQEVHHNVLVPIRGEKEKLIEIT